MLGHPDDDCADKAPIVVGVLNRDDCIIALDRSMVAVRRGDDTPALHSVVSRVPIQRPHGSDLDVDGCLKKVDVFIGLDSAEGGGDRAGIVLFWWSRPYMEWRVHAIGLH